MTVVKSCPVNSNWLILGTKYIIANGENEQPQVFNNTDANGNAWFINKLKSVTSANDEIIAIDSLNNKFEAVIGKDVFENEKLSNTYQVDSLASIKLSNDFKPNYLKYTSNNTNKGLAVFSENYYGQGWQAYLDGEKANHVRVNYVLRAMEIPAGEHFVEFKFEPEVVKTGSNIALASSIILGLLVVGSLFYEFKRKRD